MNYCCTDPPVNNIITVLVGNNRVQTLLNPCSGPDAMPMLGNQFTCAMFGHRDQHIVEGCCKISATTAIPLSKFSILFQSHKVGSHLESVPIVAKLQAFYSPSRWFSQSLK